MQETDFATWLQTELDQRGWSQADLARYSELSPVIIYRWLQGKALPNPSNSRKVARALNLNTKTVFVMAGIMSTEEAGAAADTSASPRDFSTEELLIELRRRIPDSDGGGYIE
ncbi:helix-turn-helix domain-containing protein [Actinopolyspora halophila]|uniref:helix-turn-helix domain-containing protein n=1 Tax=Actinopolyspora halophila TaxID=1850 RepID=UPI000367C0D1|nr:helix-turn-helix domain-containing protein [Actinopolyspora halophila]